MVDHEDDVTVDQPREATTCSKCGRAVYLTDVDAAGRCVLCVGGGTGDLPKRDEGGE